jgi:cellulose synthase/poly-beta-1,6-N-acetylglucosamine synthase-like glycosyltransferase
LLERDTLLQLVQPFYEDATVLVATGSLRPSNGCAMRGGTVVAAGSPANLLARLQIIDQLGRALSARLAWSLTDSLFLAPESLPLMAREVAVAVGGYRRDTPDPDADLVLRIQHWAGIQGRQMAVRDLSGAGAWVPVPETLTAVARHRARSHEHLVRTLWLNRGILRTLFTKPGKALDFLLQCAIEVLGPLAELVGLLLVLWLYATGHVDALIAMLFLSLIVIDGTLSGLLGLLMERVGAPRLRRTRDIEALAFTALLANLGWRQLDALWRLTGLCAAAVPRREPAQPALPESASPPPATLRTERRAA